MERAGDWGPRLANLSSCIGLASGGRQRLLGAGNPFQHTRAAIRDVTQPCHQRGLVDGRRLPQLQPGHQRPFRLERAAAPAAGNSQPVSGLSSGHRTGSRRNRQSGGTGSEAVPLGSVVLGDCLRAAYSDTASPIRRSRRQRPPPTHTVALTSSPIKRSAFWICVNSSAMDGLPSIALVSSPPSGRVRSRLSRMVSLLHASLISSKQYQAGMQKGYLDSVVFTACPSVSDVL